MEFAILNITVSLKNLEGADNFVSYRNAGCLGGAGEILLCRGEGLAFEGGSKI